MYTPSISVIYKLGSRPGNMIVTSAQCLVLIQQLIVGLYMNRKVSNQICWTLQKLDATTTIQHFISNLSLTMNLKAPLQYPAWWCLHYHRNGRYHPQNYWKQTQQICYHAGRKTMLKKQAIPKLDRQTHLAEELMESSLPAQVSSHNEFLCRILS